MHVFALPPQVPLKGHPTLALEQPPESAPPLGLWHCHVRVVPQAVWPLSLNDAPPLLQPSAAALLHEPAMHAALASEQLAVVPPPEPRQPQVRVVPQAICPASPVTVPAVHVAAAPPHAPLVTEQAFASA